MISDRRKIQYYAAAASTFFMFALSLLFTYIWAIAFIRGGTTRVSVNRFGEAYVELALLLVVWPIIVYGTYHTMRLQDADRWLE